MLALGFLILGAICVAQWLTIRELRARLAVIQLRAVWDPSTLFTVGVTPEKLKEGRENNIHRKTPFPKIP